LKNVASISSRSEAPASSSNQQMASRVRVAPGIEIAYRVDDFCDGWLHPDAVIMLHGIAETGDAFKPWVPHFARHCRVIRPDLRGFGQSSPLTEHEQLSIEALADDIAVLVDALQLGRVHLVGTKLGAQIGLELAQRRPALLTSMTLAGVLISPGKAIGHWVEQWINLVDQGGVENWAGTTMAGRMGSSLSAEAMEWWIRYMGSAPASAVKACFRMLPRLTEPAHLEDIVSPTMVIVAAGAGQASQFNQRQSVADVGRWVKRIPRSKIVEIGADSYHVAASHPDQCADVAYAFIASQGLTTGRLAV
jgi:3-oxoadipate enol-lactonase